MVASLKDVENFQREGTYMTFNAKADRSLLALRHRKRVPTRLPFDVYDRTRHLGRFWTCNVSQEGLFLKTVATDCLRGILDLRFQADGLEHRLRGVVVHRVHEQGVGLQLAFWRNGDRVAHKAYLQISGTGLRCLGYEISPRERSYRPAQHPL